MTELIEAEIAQADEHLKVPPQKLSTPIVSHEQRFEVKLDLVKMNVEIEKTCRFKC